MAKVAGRFFAVDDRCPHLGASLARGTLEGTVVTCVRHGSQFDLADGRVVRWTDWAGWKARLAKVARPPRPLATHRVRVEGENVLVEV